MKNMYLLFSIWVVISWDAPILLAQKNITDEPAPVETPQGGQF